jgi:predicted phosphoribosyltransferase
MPFADREHAGRALGVALATHKCRHPVVLGLPRGGLPVAREVAEMLNAPLDVLVVRKLGAPNGPELAIGAVGEHVTLIDEDLVSMLGVSDEWLTRAVVRERGVVQRRLADVREVRRAVPLRERCVILVDDGIATGATMEAAVRAVRSQRPLKVVVAAPLASVDAAAWLRSIADEVVILETPDPFIAVDAHYVDFAPVSDADVRAMLAGQAELVDV